PSAQLDYSTQYTLSVTTGVQDVAGNSLSTLFNATVTVQPNPDTTRPTVISTAPFARRDPPMDNASFVDVFFSEPMNTAPINTNSFKIRSTKLNSEYITGGTVTY